VVARLIRRPWRRLKRAAKALRKDLPDIRWHAVRIRAKRCCYAAEAVAPVVGCQAGRFAAAIAAVQAILGDHQDTVMAGAWLRATGAAVSQTCIAAGEPWPRCATAKPSRRAAGRSSTPRAPASTWTW
jgi:CHAD domain-containing protein